MPSPRDVVMLKQKAPDVYPLVVELVVEYLYDGFPGDVLEVIASRFVEEPAAFEMELSANQH